MTTFESNIITIPHPSNKIFQMLSNLENLQRIVDKLPADKFKDISFDADRCSVSVDPVGKIAIRIIEREPDKTIKFASDEAPIDFNLWIQLKEIAPDDTKAKITIKAELNSFMASMVESPLREALNKLADMIAAIPY